MTQVLDLISGRKKYHNKAGHFVQRWQERVGELLSKEQLKELEQHVYDTGEFLHRTDSNGSCYAIQYKGMRIRVVYNRFERYLYTVLS